MSRVTPRAARLAAWIAVPAALVASGVVVSTASYSAFSATTSTPTSNWTAGTVALSNDATANTALFAATNLKPGSTDSRCITVTSSGSLPSTVKLYATSPQTTSVLATNTTIKIEQGTGGGFASCAGFTPAATGGTLFNDSLPNLGTQATGFGNGLGAWTTTGGTNETRVYRVTYSVAAATPNAAQGTAASIGLTWEAQNN